MKNNINNYEIIEDLNKGKEKGSFGLVYKVLNKKDNEYYVMKKITFNINNKDKIEKEVKILSSINNEYIVKYFESFIDNEFFIIIMEFCEHSDLSEYIKQKKKENQLIDQNVILFIILNICIGLKEIHKNNIIHRDLKPENLFLSKDYKIKIGDFGISKELEDDKYVHNTQTGTYEYMAPEIIKKRNNKFNNKIDLWSLGCIIYELCTLNKCFTSDEGLFGTFNKIINQKHGTINTNYYSREIQDLIDNLLNKDYHNRYDIDQVYDLVFQYNTQLYLIKNNNNNLDETSKNILNNRKIFFADKTKNEIIMTIKIDKSEINKDIYFLDNTDYIDKEGIRHYHDNLKELNEHNTELYINDKQYKYEKYFKFEKEGIYRIKLVFKIPLKDCSHMFDECEKLINIDLSNFNTGNVTDMSYMFSKCKNLVNMDFSKFDTKNVTDMNHMFSWCKNLTDLDLSKFDTKNVTKMSYMFYLCENLKKINLSKFNTKSVTNMNHMFSWCKNLTDLDLSKFETKNATNMSDMFTFCEKLTNLDLSKFVTDKVTNMSFMFYCCKNLTNLDLSNFDNKSATDMNLMFYWCENLKRIVCKDKDIKNIFKDKKIKIEL